MGKYIYLDKDGASVEAVLNSSNDILVKKGSVVSNRPVSEEFVNSSSAYQKRLELISDKVISREGVFLKNYHFDNLDFLTVLILGYGCATTVEWTDDLGVSLERRKALAYQKRAKTRREKEMSPRNFVFPKVSAYEGSLEEDDDDAYTSEKKTFSAFLERKKQESRDGWSFDAFEKVSNTLIDPDLLYLKPSGSIGRKREICFSGVGKVLDDRKFLLKSGSKVSEMICKSISPRAESLRRLCEKNGSIKNGITTEDIEFASARLAAEFVLGFRQNKQWPWRNISGDPVNS